MQDENVYGSIEDMIKKIVDDPHDVDKINDLILHLEKVKRESSNNHEIKLRMGDALQGFLGLLHVIKFLIRYQHQTQDKIDELTISLNSYGRYIERLEKRINEFEMKSLR